MDAIYTSTRIVQSYESDSYDRLKPFYLFNYFQEAANAHANESGFGQAGLKKPGYLWILARLSVVLNDMPKAGMLIDEETWVQFASGKLTNRAFSIKSVSKSQVMATSQWVCISRESRKPSNIPQSLIDKMIIEENPGFEFGLKKLQAFQNSVASVGSIRVKFADIDLAGHTNNANYVQWALMGFDNNFHKKFILKTLDINFLGESFEGDTLDVQMEKMSANNYKHEVIHASSKQILCRLETCWRPI